MRSRAEQLARGLALVLVALAIWRVLTWQRPAAEPVQLVAPLRPSLVELSGTAVPAVHLSVDRVPDVVERDWLVALRRAGTTVTWSDAGLPPAAALSAAHLADPSGAVAIAVATSGSGHVSILDTLGAIDSVPVGSHGARLVAPSAQGRVIARRDGEDIASVQPPPARTLRPVLVLGSAGWEAKFVIAALEEDGWAVHARIRVSPTSVVTQGAAARFDTANYSAVIVLDTVSVASPAPLLAYVRSGGGLVLAGDAGRTPALAAVTPARLGALVPGSLLRSASAGAREGLPMYPLTSLRVDAASLDSRDGRLVAAARRASAGRVVLVGETESWRWRMAGGDDGPAQHRRWWSRIVASAAHAPLAAIPSVDPEAAPHAALIDALGAARLHVPTTQPSPTPALPAWLGASILGLLLLEWASRRLRGER